MNALVRDKLRELLTQHGETLGEEPRRLRALLADECPNCKREINVVIMAAELRIPEALQRKSAPVPWPLFKAQLMSRLVEDAALSEEAARWAIDTWAAALGIHAPETGPQAAPITVAPVEPKPPTSPPAAIPARPTAASSSHLQFSTLHAFVNRAAFILMGLLALFFVVAIGIAFFFQHNPDTLARQEAKKKATPTDIRSGLVFSTDPESLRWDNDKIVQDLAIVNNDEDLTNFDARLSVSYQYEGDRAFQDWSQNLAFPDWRKGERKTLTAPAGNLTLFGLAGSARKTDHVVRVDILPSVPLGPGTVKPYRIRAPFEAIISRFPTRYVLKVKRLEEPLSDVEGYITCFPENGAMPIKNKVFRAQWARGETLEHEIAAFPYPRIEFLAIARRQKNVENLAKGLPEPGRVLLREIWNFEWKK